MSESGRGRGSTRFLVEVEPETLPDDTDRYWREVRRRAEAWRDGRDGWRTGDIDSSLAGFDDGADGRRA